LVTESGDVLEIVNQDLITAHAGHHVKVNGTLDEAAKTITVEKVSMVEAKAPEKKS
jgi:hypothetical protein